MAQPERPLPDHPGPHPPPPSDLSHRPLPLREVRPPWFRCHWADLGAIHFGRSRRNRFDDPLCSFGVLYVAVDPEGAFIETFGQATGEVILTETALKQRTLTVISANRSLMLVDLTGAGLVHVGADARLWSGEHRVAQAYSRAFYEHPSRPDGIYYPARHDPSRKSVALFDREDLDLWSTPLGFDLLSRILTTYQLTIVPE